MEALVLLALVVYALYCLARERWWARVHHAVPPTPSQAKWTNSRREMAILTGWKLNLLRWLPHLPLLGPLYLRTQAALLRLDYTTLAAFNVQDRTPTLFPAHTLLARQDAAAREGSGTPVWPATAAAASSSWARPGFVDYERAFRSGTTSPVEVAQRLVAAVRESNSGPHALHAIIALDETDLLAQARASAERHRTGTTLSRWDGIPITIKDELDVAGYATRVGTAFVGSDIKTRDATVVTRLRAAGFLIAGKANMMEIGVQPFGFNGHWGHCKNPYEAECDSGGSSSGSACAVSAGLVPGAVGADGGGSIRVPSCFCGVVGLKAQHGRIPETGAYPLCSSVGHVGPIASNVHDVHVLYDILRGPDAHDPLSAALPVVPGRRGYNPLDLRGWRIGVCSEWVDSASSEPCKDNFRASLKRFTELGATVVNFTVPCFDQVRLAHTGTILSEMRACMLNQREHWHQMMAVVNMALQVAGTMDGAFFVTAQKLRTFAIEVFEDLYQRQGVDVVLTPTTGCLPPRFHLNADMSQGISDVSTMFDTMLFVGVGNFIGNPAISVPNGFHQGLPTGLHIMSRPFCESDALFLAHVAEREQVRPKAFHDVLPSK